MSNLIARLREGQRLCAKIGLEDASIYKEAADEIERLREIFTVEQVALLDNYAQNLWDAGYYTQSNYLSAFSDKCKALILD